MLASWLRRHSRLGSGRTRPLSRRGGPTPCPFRRPVLERLEDRSLLAQFQDFHGLRFVADAFLPGNGDLLVSGGTVQLGFTPASQNENFLSLVNINLNRDGDNGGALRIQTTSAPATFQVTNAALQSVVQGGAAVPIWQTADDTTAVTFNVPQLLSANGYNLPGGSGTPFTVAGFAFTLDVLGFANPGGGGTSDANVFMQGSIAFTALKDKTSLTAPKVEVNGGNYVIADSSGVQLTGATFSLANETKSFNAQSIRTTDVGVVVTYAKNSQTHGRDVWSFDGAVTITTQPQGTGTDPALSSVSATIGMVLQDGHILGLNFGVSAAFTFLGVQVQSDAGNPLQFNFDFGKDRYQVRGGMTVTIKGSNTVDVNLGYSDTKDDRGIIIQDGVVTALNATVNTNFTLFGASITTNNDGLNFSYDRAEHQFEMYGELQVTVPSGKDSTGHDKTTSITALLGDASNPGLQFTGSKLVQVHMGVTGQFNVYGLAFQANELVMDWKNQGGQDLFELSGSVAVANVFSIEASFGTAQNPGLKVIDGKFSLDAFTFTAERLNFGAFVIQDLTVAYQADPKQGYTLAIVLDFIFPGGWQLGGELELVDGEVNDISLHLGAGDETIPIADTGLFLNYAEVSVDNIHSPANLVVSGVVSFVYGEEVTLFGKQVAVVAAQGSVTVDKDELQLSGAGYFGAFQTGVDGQGKPLYQGTLGEGDAQVTLDWGGEKYAAEVTVSLLDGVVELGADFSFAGDRENYTILIKADVAVEIPRFVPFVGGKKLDGLNFVFDYHSNGGDPYGFFAAWFELDIFHKFDVGFQVDVVTHKFSLIGSKGVAHIGDIINGQQDQRYTYTATFPVEAGATGGLFAVDWPAAGGTQSIAIIPPGQGAPIDQDDFSTDNGLSLVADGRLQSATSLKVHAVGSSQDNRIPLPSGQYQVILTSTEQYATAPTFTSSYFYPRPTAAVGALPASPAEVLVTVPLSGTVDQGLAAGTKVSLYVDPDGGGYDGTLVPDAGSFPVQTDGQGNWTATATWDLTGLLPLPYSVYAVVNDGVNAPTFSAYSTTVTPQPPLSGTVNDPEHDYRALSGQRVWLDVNNNGRFDPDVDPNEFTGPTGFYAFYETDSKGHTVLPRGTPVGVGVVVPPGYEPPAQNPVRVTYTGTPLAVNFGMAELASVTGTVFEDLNQNGVREAGEAGVPGVLVTLTGAAGPTLTAYSRSDGSYQFYDLSNGLTGTVGVTVPGAYYQTGPAPVPPGTYAVAITDPYQLVTGQDFGVLPYGQVAGTVLGRVLQNGQPSPTPTPLAGWTVNLLSGSRVVATTTSGADGSYLFERVRAGAYTTTLDVPAGWRQVAPFQADVRFASPGQVLATGAAPNSVTTGDFDADGFQDFAVTAPGRPGGNVLVYYGNGQGSFVSQQLQASFADPAKVVAFRFAGTNRVDLAVANTTGQVDVFRSDPGRLFTLLAATWQLPAGSGALNNMVAGTFDGDATEDLAVTFLSGQYELKFAALLANAARDVIVNPSRLAGPFDPSRDGPVGVASGDINNDGQGDLLINSFTVGSNSFGPSIEYGDGTGHFRLSTAIGLLPILTVAGLTDVNGDGFLDLIVGGYTDGHAMKVWMQDPLGQFSNAGGFGHTVKPSSDATPIGIVLADFSGDLKPDLAFGLQSGVLDVFPNEGQDPYYRHDPALVQALAVGSAPVAMAAADFTGDGLADLVFADPGAGGVRLLLNQSTNTSPALAVTVGSGQVAIGNDFVAVQVPASTPPPEDPDTYYLRGLYLQVLGRAPDEAGLRYWAATLAGGAARSAVANALWNSPEHRGRQVDTLYLIHLNRQPDPDGRRFWVEALLAGMTEDALTRAVLTSTEYLAAHGADLADLYTALLGRPADAGGMAYWQSALQAGGTWGDVLTAFQRSEEAVLRRLDSLYATLLGRTADASGRRFWLEQIQTGARTLDEAAMALLASDEYFSRLASGGV